jgi:hypothetical protein
MGLTIHYALHARIRNPRRATELIGQLRSKALDLPFKEVGEVVELSGRECEYQDRDRDDPLRWLLKQAGHYVADGNEYHEVRPDQLVAFSTWPGEGCEQANFGLALYPKTIEVEDWSGKKKTLGTDIERWSWKSFCKTEYASDPTLGGIENFLRCHLSVIHLLDKAEILGILKEVSDEGTYREKRDVRSLAEEVVRWNQQMAGLAGKMKDLLGSDVEAAIMKFQNFEHLEAEGRKDELWGDAGEGV